MNKQILNIINFQILYEILDEIKENLFFEVVNYKDKNEFLKKNKTTDDKYYNIYSNKELKELNFKSNFISVESGVDRTIDWINKNWKIFKKSNLEYKHRK